MQKSSGFFAPPPPPPPSSCTDECRPLYLTYRLCFQVLPRRSPRGPLNLVNILKYKSLQVSVINMYLYRGINEHFVFLLLVGTDRIVCI